MTRFEEIGVERQESSANIVEAQNNLEKSCEICAQRVGKGLSCERCAIRNTFNTLKELVFMPKVVIPRSAATTKKTSRDWSKLPIKETTIKAEKK